MIVYENFGFGKWRKGVGTVRASGGDVGGGSEMLCVGRTRQWFGGVSPTLTGDHENRVTDYTSVAVYDTTQITCPNNYSNPRPGDPCHPLAAQQHAPLAVYPEVTGALCANSHPGSYTGQDAFNDMLPVYQYERRYIVRRLTPLECCRLQGFPDWWEDGAEGGDSARYKMWGNGIALPCAVDVLGRIANELSKGGMTSEL